MLWLKADFFAFIKILSARRDELLYDDDMYVNRDGGSFSIDGSDKLATFSDISLYYGLVFDKIPSDQLVHVFESDSYSNYYRNNNNLPSEKSGTNMINRLYNPK